MPGLTERRNSRLTPWLYSRAVVVNLLRMLWVGVLVWGEFGTYFWSISSCSWPDSDLPASLNKQTTHVLLVSDPQVRQPSIFRDESSWSGVIKQLIYDVTLKKSWKVTKRLQPDVVFFLGDMLASGRTVTSEKEYAQYLQKFANSFPLDSNTLAYYIPGNEDVGMGVARPSVNIRHLFAENFGPFNREVQIHNHTFVLLDVPGLIDEDYQRSSVGMGYNEWPAVRGGTIEFVKNFGPGQNPVILLTHIPLYRKDTASCGPLREKGNIRKGVGHGYQNLVGKQTTTFLLENFRASLIFSGDNRDYCEHTHEFSTLGIGIPEVTVKSFSNTRHIQNPGFQLLSLGDVPMESLVSQTTFATRPCLLPSERYIYGRLYPTWAFFTLLLLLFFNVHRSHRIRRFFIPPMSLTTARSPTSPIRSVPDSAIWTPFSAVGSASIRTPNASSRPTFRSASRPATPLATTTVPIAPVYHDDEENEDMYPAQYAQRVEYADTQEETWSLDHDHPDESWHRNSTSAVNWTKRAQGWNWRWSFSVGGRRVTIRIPSLSWSAIRDLIGLLGDRTKEDAAFNRRGMMRSIMIDLASIGWTSILTWLIMAWWTF